MHRVVVLGSALAVLIFAVPVRAADSTGPIELTLDATEAAVRVRERPTGLRLATCLFGRNRFRRKSWGDTSCVQLKP